MADKAPKKENFFVRTGRRIARFFRDTRGEMKKVVWPSRKQVINNLIIVLVFVVVFAVFIFLLDLLFVWLMDLMLRLADGGGAAGNDVSSIVSSVVSSLTSSAA